MIMQRLYGKLRGCSQSQEIVNLTDLYMVTELKTKHNLISVFYKQNKTSISLLILKQARIMVVV